MATMTVKRLLDNVAEILQDTSEDEDDRLWSESDMVDMYNREVRYLIGKYPDANAIVKAIKLASGYRHFIPSEGVALISAIMNMGTDGATPGVPIVKCELAELQVSDRGWSAETADDEILNIAADPADPRAFYTYPPADGTSYILEQYSILPTEIIWDSDGDWETAVVEVQEKYVGMLEKRILARCYKRDTDIPGNMARENDNQQEAEVM